MQLKKQIIWNVRDVPIYKTNTTFDDLDVDKMNEVPARQGRQKSAYPIPSISNRPVPRTDHKRVRNMLAFIYL